MFYLSWPINSLCFLLWFSIKHLIIKKSCQIWFKISYLVFLCFLLAGGCFRCSWIIWWSDVGFSLWSLSVMLVLITHLSPTTVRPMSHLSFSTLTSVDDEILEVMLFGILPSLTPSSYDDLYRKLVYAVSIVLMEAFPTLLGAGKAVTVTCSATNSTMGEDFDGFRTLFSCICK